MRRVSDGFVDMALTFDYADVLGQFEPRVVERGVDYFDQGRVTGLNIAQDGHVLSGLVRGRGRRPYKVHAVLREDDSGVDVDGHCTCPVGYNCKHVVALLFAALEDHEAAPAKSVSRAADVSAVDAWFRELDQASQPPSQRGDYPPDVSQRLLYVLRARDYERASVLEVDFQSVRRLKAGGYGKSHSGNTHQGDPYEGGAGGVLGKGP